MKDFTKRLFEKGITNIEATAENTKINAEKAEEIIGMPKELYNEMAINYPMSKLCKDINNSDEKQMAFFAGLAIGWAENNKDIK